MNDVVCVPYNACVYGHRELATIVPWVVINGIAFLVTLSLVLDARRDLTALRESRRNGQRRRYLRGGLRTQALLGVAQLLLFVPGVAALYLPPPILRPVHQAAGAFIVLLEAAALALLAVSVGEKLDRRALRRMSERKEDR